MRLPAFDYRPYHVGADLRAGTGMGADDMGPVYDVKIVYEREGEQMELDIDDEDQTVVVEFGSNKNCRIIMNKTAIAQVEKAN